MENYEQKYKEALGQAKQAIENIPDKSLANWLRNIFPELKESEDDKAIRLLKKIVDNNEILSRENTNICYAWLESQRKESLPVEEIELNSLAFLTELGYTCIPPKNHSSELSKEDEEMLTSTIDDTVQENKLDDRRIKWLKSLKPQPEQEWTEDDKSCLLEVETNFKLNNDKMTPSLIDKYNRFFNKIKSLKPQQNHAWNEEDEDNLNGICMYLMCSNSPDGYKDWIDWLKSIKLRWKPSECDISLLEEIARNIRNNIRPFCSEVSSLEDLIKNIKTL